MEGDPSAVFGVFKQPVPAMPVCPGEVEEYSGTIKGKVMKISFLLKHLSIGNYVYRN